MTQPQQDPAADVGAALARLAEQSVALQRQIGTLRDEMAERHRSCQSRIDLKMEAVYQRFADMDKATELLLENVTRVPTDLQKATSDLLRLMDERDHRVQEHFAAISHLSEAETNLNQTALRAALAAQEKATAVSAASLDRTIEKNAELAAQQDAALSARVTALSEQLYRAQQQTAEILAGKQAVGEAKTETRGGATVVFGIIGAAVGVISLLIVAVTVIIGTR